MSDLRSACIEAMAEAIVVRITGKDAAWPRPDDFATQMYRQDAAAAFDALLGVLEEHAQEWQQAADSLDEIPLPTTQAAGMIDTTPLWLLAVLREDT